MTCESSMRFNLSVQRVFPALGTTPADCPRPPPLRRPSGRPAATRAAPPLCTSAQLGTGVANRVLSAMLYRNTVVCYHPADPGRRNEERKMATDYKCRAFMARRDADCSVRQADGKSPGLLRNHTCAGEDTTSALPTTQSSRRSRLTGRPVRNPRKVKMKYRVTGEFLYKNKMLK